MALYGTLNGTINIYPWMFAFCDDMHFGFYHFGVHMRLEGEYTSHRPLQPSPTLQNASFGKLMYTLRRNCETGKNHHFSSSFMDYT